MHPFFSLVILTRRRRPFACKPCCDQACARDCAASFLAIVFALGFFGAIAEAAVFAGVDDGTRNRFLGGGAPTLGASLAVNPNFPIDESLISGIAIDSNGFAHKSAILITPRHYVAANHYATTAPWFRGSDGIIREYSTVSSTLLTTDFVFEGMMMSGNSDIRVWTLDDSVPLPGDHGVNVMPILVGPAGGFLGRELHAGDRHNQFGRNIIEDLDIATFSNTDGVPNQPTHGIIFDFDTLGGGLGVGPDEIHLASGDSGNAAIAVVDGNVALIGNHFGVLNTVSPQLSVSTWLSPYVEQINNYTFSQAGSYTVATILVVPEPGSVSLLLLGTVILTLRRNNRNFGTS